MNYKLIANRLRRLAMEIEEEEDLSLAPEDFTETNEEYLRRIVSELDGQPVPGTSGIHLDFEPAPGEPHHEGGAWLYVVVEDPALLAKRRWALSRPGVCDTGVLKEWAEKVDMEFGVSLWCDHGAFGADPGGFAIIPIFKKYIGEDENGNDEEGWCISVDPGQDAFSMYFNNPEFKKRITEEFFGAKKEDFLALLKRHASSGEILSKFKECVASGIKKLTKEWTFMTTSSSLSGFYDENGEKCWTVVRDETED